MRWFFPILLALAVAATSAPPEVHGCAAVPPRGGSVGVNAEEAIIVYDSATRTEHFIRRADFRSEVKDFGFLVPTPDKPELGEVDAQAFGALQSATAPRHVPSGNVKRIVRKRNEEATGRAMPTHAAPHILDRKKVAGFDAVVLRAEDTDGLKQWLEENKYDARPAVVEWLKWYVDHKWIITAFKVSRDGGAERDRWAKSVRMTFSTDAPFYPYREPEDMRTSKVDGGQAHQRKLRVFFLADARYQGTLGDAGAWPAKTVWSNSCPKETLAQLVANFRASPKESENFNAKTWHLTEFEDDSSPRLGTDEVYFHRAEDQAAVERPVIYYDRYEYVDEEEPPTTNTKKDVNPDENQVYVWLIPGAVGTAIFLGAIVFLILRKKL